MQVEQLKTACRDLTTELEKGRTENGRLQDAHANIVAERGALSSKLGEMRAQHSQLQGEHAGLKGQFEELASQRSEAVQHLEELEAEHRCCSKVESLLVKHITVLPDAPSVHVTRLHRLLPGCRSCHIFERHGCRGRL